jgi:hypothetical protein
MKRHMRAIAAGAYAVCTVGAVWGAFGVWPNAALSAAMFGFAFMLAAATYAAIFRPENLDRFFGSDSYSKILPLLFLLGMAAIFVLARTS